MATSKQRKAVQKIVENNGSVSAAMREAGYSPATAKNPKALTESKAWKDLMAEYLPDEDIAKAHRDLLTATTLDHMVFPIYRDSNTEQPEGDELEPQAHGGALKRQHTVTEGTNLTDTDIEELLAEVGCKVRRIVHSETARHVYFWTADNAARKAAVEIGWKVKGRLQPKLLPDDEDGIFGKATKLTIEFVDAPETEPDPGPSAQPAE